MHFPTRFVAVAGAAVVAIGGASSSALANTVHVTEHSTHHKVARDGFGYGSPVAGYVYTDDNTTTANTIAGFARHADGSLTPLSGSPFPAGGVGLGKGNASQGSVATAYYGRYVLAVDNASNQISVLKVGWDGSLTPVGSPVSSGGTDPVSIGVSGNLVYVANATVGSANLVGFRISPKGVLTPIANSTVTLGALAQPDDVVFNADGTNLIVPDVNESVIYSYSVGANGLLTAAPDSPITAPVAGPFGSVFNPANPSQLFVSLAHGGAAAGAVGAYNVGSDGTFSAIGASPFADFETAPCWTAITPDGRYLFAVNTGTPSISSYAVNPDGSLTLIGAFPFKLGAGTHPTDVTVAGDDVYVKGPNDVAVLRIVWGGFLSELSSSPVALPAGDTTTSGIVATS